MLATGLCLSAITPVLWAQSAQQQNPSSSSPSGQSTSPSQGDNPFPEEAPKAQQAKPAAGQSGARPGGKQTGQQAGQGDDSKQKPASDNPFPGEDPNAPIIPVDPGPGNSASGAGSGSAPRQPAGDAGSVPMPRRGADPDGDPVRSPDPSGNVVDDDGFSSSRSGLKQMPAEDTSDERPGKSTKNKTRSQEIAEDVNVGKFYLEQKNWRAAQARFAAAFALDAENPDSVWGLAEAERHLQMYKEATEHYKLFLSYDPDGPHSRAAHKALDEVESARK